MNQIISGVLSRGRTVMLVFLLVLVAGTIAYVSIPKESQPDITIPIVYVSMHHEGISPEDAERMLIRPMEKELRGMDGLKEMTATAYQSGANVMLEFQAGMDIDTALQDVREAVDIAKAELPEETDEPTVNEVNLALMPVVVVSLSGNIPERQLVRTAKDLRDAIEGISEVLEVDIGGLREEVVEIVVDPLMFDTYQLNLNEIGQAASRNNVLVAAGDLDSGTGRLPVKVPGLFEAPEEFFNLPIKTVGDTVIRVRDIATVRPTFKDPDGFSRLNGQPALNLYVKKRVGENLVSAVDQVREVVKQESARWPEGMEVTFSQDQSDDIRSMLLDLQNNVISAILLVMVVCIIALGIRGGLLVGIAIPGSFLAGILILYFMGLTVNMIVLFSLIMAVGMLVDGAIVVTELADRKMNEGLHRKEAYAIASQRMAWPIISSTATTLAAFMPLLFWPGIVGEFMKFLPITLIATLSASLVMALIFVPVMGSFWGKPGPASEAQMKSLAAAEGGDILSIGGLTGTYVRVLNRALHHPVKILFGMILLFLLVIPIYFTFGKGVEFFPNVDPETATIKVRTRGNLSIDEIDRQVQEVERRIAQVPGIESVVARSGISLTGDGVTEDTHGLIQLNFLDWDQRQTGFALLREIELRSNGITDFAYETIPAAEGYDLGLAVRSRVPLGGTRLERNLQGLVDRIALVRPVAGSLIESGSQLQTGEKMIGDMTLIPGVVDNRNLLEKMMRKPIVPPAKEGEEASPPPTYTWAQLKEAAREVMEERENLSISFVEPEGEAARGHIRVVRTDKGGSLQSDGAILKDLKAALEKTDEIRFVSYRMGPVPDGGLLEENTLVGRVYLNFGDGVSGQQAQWESILANVKPFLVGIPGVVVEQQAAEAGPPQGKDVQIELSSHSPELLEQAVRTVRGILETTEGLKDVDDSRPVPGVEWQVLVDRSEAARYGADIATVGSYVQFVTNGLMLGTYRPDYADDEVDIRVRFPEGNRHLTEIGNLKVTTTQGVVPLKNFVDFAPAEKVGQIERVDARRVLRVTANVDEGYLTDTKVRELQDWAQNYDIPEGLSVRFRGQNEDQAESMAFLSQAFLVAMAIMFIILVTQFNSIYQSLLILLAVLFSTIGVFLGLLITHQPFGVVMNGIGVIALAGIVVNNNIVLIDTFDSLHKRGLHSFEAALRCCAQRLRPVMLTTVTTILGLMPMVLKLNIDFVNFKVSYNAPSSQWWVQLSTSIAFGLAFATVLTLVLTPCLLVLGARLSGEISREEHLEQQRLEGGPRRVEMPD
ncbi:MAG: efflux RND transporter permease subunit [Verrucomicrobiota bacterium JB022]|nr:efflux RND transporter permease subunit [Verrucomicrobiota bacterium JB022]